MGQWNIQALKAAGLCAVVVLAATLGGSGGMLGTGLLAQAQQAPKPTAPVKAKPRAEEVERWRQTIVRAQRPEKACFVAKYPATAWTKVPCGRPPKGVFLARKGPPSIKLVGQGTGGGDDVAQSAGLIK